MRVRKRIRLLMGVIFSLLLTGMITGGSVQAADKKVAKVALGGAHSAAIATDGSLWMWGSNDSGALGNGKKGNDLCEGTPIKVLDNVVSVSLSTGSTYDAHSGAVTRDGSLYMWGCNSSGQLGDGTTTDQLKPKKVLTGVSQVVLGHRKTAAIKTDGSLWVCGSNENNGLGANGNQKKFVKILDDVVQVDFGSSHGAALKRDGSIWMWGNDTNGQLCGINGSPKKLEGMTDVKQISLGHNHSGALKTDGSLWMWGDNGDGQLGDNISERNVRTPKKIMTGVRQFSLGQWASGIVKTDGSLWMCGYNYYIRFSEYAPKKLADGAALVELGDTHNAMIKTDGSLWTWGGGWRGQLGDGVVNLAYGHNVKNPAKISIGGTPKTDSSSSGKGTTTVGAGLKKAVPKKNSTFTISNITYKVTRSDAKKGTVTLLKGNKKKTSVAIPATVKKNGYAFKVTQISGKAFYKHTKLKKVTLGKNINSIGANAFRGCTSLTAVSLNGALVTIGDYAFSGCKKLTKLVIPAKVKTIGKEAFSKDSRLKTIQIQSTVLKKVGKKALSGIHKKATIKVPSKKLKVYQKLLKKKGQASSVKIKK